jgi:hypothetical protein
LTLAQNFAIIPHAEVDITGIVESGLFVTFGIPPATNASHDLGDGLVISGGGGGVGEEVS